MIDNEKYVKVVVNPLEPSKQAGVVNNTDIVITQNGVYEPEPPYTGFGKVDVSVPTSGAVIEPLSITPTTSAQSIVAPTGVDGYSPISVNAVTAGIDSNIQAGNIKAGVSILGVSGNVVELKGETRTETLSSSAGNTFTPSSGKNGITSITVTPTNQAVTFDPYTYQQTKQVPTNFSGHGTITVNAVTSAIDSNITAGNIKSGVSILGVVGTYGAPKYYISKSSQGGVLGNNSSSFIDLDGISTIGEYVLSYAYYGSNISGSINMGSITAMGQYACQYMFYNCTYITSVDLGSLSVLNYNYSCDNMFAGCVRLASVDISSLSSVSGQYACQSMFYGCTALTTVDLSSLTTVSGYESCYQMFRYCSNLETADLSNLQTISNSYSICGMFSNCASLRSVDLSGLTTISGSYGNLQRMFDSCSSLTAIEMPSLTTVTCSEAFRQICLSCSNLTSVDLSSLSVLSGSSACYGMFWGCTSLTNISFPALNSNSFGNNTNQFGNMLYGVSGCTVHFPSNLQSVIGSWSDVTNGFGGTNTTVLFDLPATT